MRCINHSTCLTWSLLTGDTKIITAVKYDINECKDEYAKNISIGLLNYQKDTHKNVSDADFINCGMNLDPYRK